MVEERPTEVPQGSQSQNRILKMKKKEIEDQIPNVHVFFSFLLFGVHLLCNCENPAHLLYAVPKKKVCLSYRSNKVLKNNLYVVKL